MVHNMNNQHQPQLCAYQTLISPCFSSFLLLSGKQPQSLKKCFPSLKRRHISVTDCCVSDLVSIELLLCTVITLQLSEGHSDEFFPLMVASCNKLLVNDTAIVTFSVLPRVKAVETPILSHFIRLSILFLFWL